LKHTTIVKKVEKALGVKVHGNPGEKYWFQYENNIGSWRTQDHWETGVLEGRGFHVRHKDDHTDAQVDYFAGSFLDNATQMINWCKPPEAKFPIGALVRGKQNKRAIRQGYAGKTGLVTSTGTYIHIAWCGEEKPQYAMSYPERDIELVSAA
jgi:hypothetical protein